MLGIVTGVIITVCISNLFVGFFDIVTNTLFEGLRWRCGLERISYKIFCKTIDEEN